MNTKTFVLLFLALTFINFSGYAQQQGKINKIVIDAGHGGKDPGCLGLKSKEKDVNLKVALKLGQLIKDNYSDVKVIYTRDTDIAVELYRRAQIANDHHADLFISIHCNAAESKTPRGVETFVMGLSKSEANIAVARKENAAILKEKNYENNYEGFNPNSPEADIIFSLYTSAYLKNSALLASKVQRNLILNTKLIDRKVQQASFWVLYKVAMPSILVELGFLSNSQEEEYLIQVHNQDVMAVSLYNAFVEYKNQIEGTNKPLMPLPKASKETKEEKEVTTTVEVKTDENPTVTESKPEAEKNTEHTIRFRVQFLASPDDLSVNHQRFQSLKEVKKYYENKMWKYTCGDEETFEKAQVLAKEVKTKHPDAFIIAFKNDEKITVDEAKQLIKK